MLCTIIFPPILVDTIRLDEILLECRDPHSIHYKHVRFVFAEDCVITIDAVMRVLSLANQILCSGKRVGMAFEGDLSKIMGYLDRMSFFDFLDPAIEVLPSRPERLRASTLGKRSNEQIEVIRVGVTKIEQIVVSQMVNSLLQNFPDGKMRNSLDFSLYTVLGELISNIQRHASILELDGFVALQTYYDAKHKFCIAASDSSFGLIETLRPVLGVEYPKLASLEDSELIQLMFSRGLSRFGEEHGGTGLSSCRRIVSKFNATIEVRQNFSRFRIEKPNKVKINIKTNDYLPYLWGTHICFNFSVDSH